ncbi:dihydrofolate synthetase isoform X2 [Phoenix dactylifera]|uniref:Dihydrofolate synthetase isoform X2 n=1 Tax=Phoenix dactylifera TaxID=42345 RepID=A0A8B9AFA2_PHODC|nr:dihydrofolate synthetase isoform X2 [Phoenix dactylifera]
MTTLLSSYKPFRCNPISHPSPSFFRSHSHDVHSPRGILERKAELEGVREYLSLHWMALKFLNYPRKSLSEFLIVKRGMQCLARSIFSFCHMRIGTEVSRLAPRFLRSRLQSAMSEDPELGDFLDYMENLKNYERSGVPRGAGTDSDDGFDLGRMRRLLQRLGNPHTQFKAVHIAGTKGKGSTAAFLSNILREEGYLVGCYTSPHLLTIRERISFGRNGVPVSAEVLKNVFHRVKGILDHSIELENGALTHFEVFTALAFLLFSQAKVDIAIIEAGLGGARDATNVICNTELSVAVITSIGEEHLAALGGSLESIAMAKSGIIKHGCPVVIGGPFEPHIEHIIRDRAFLMNSPVISSCDPGIQSVLKCSGRENGNSYQTCDIFIQVQKDLQLSIDLPNVKLCMLGNHQRLNAVTATCTALCLRSQGWAISDESIRAGLERTQLLGRSQFLTQDEASAIGLSGTSILIDGAHTEASAKGLADVIQMMHPDGALALVVAMASDKDHLAFAKQLLSGPRPEIVLLTEVTIAGGKSRVASASTLKDFWIRAALDLGIDFVDIGVIDHGKNLEGHKSESRGSSDHSPAMLVLCHIGSVSESIKAASQLLQSRIGNKPSVVVATGSLYVVSSVLRLCTTNQFLTTHV